MNRTFLRLVEPLSDQIGLPEMTSSWEKTSVLTEKLEIEGILQLFLLWPEYASAVLRVDHSYFSVVVAHDEALVEVDGLFLKTEKTAFQLLQTGKHKNLKLLFEVFGLTFQFQIPSIELSENYQVDEPSIAIPLPTSIEQLGVRRSRRVQLADPLPTRLSFNSSELSAELLEVSPRGFKFKIRDKIAPPPSDRFKMVVAEMEVEFRLGQMREEMVIGLPCEDDPKNFGRYFDLYIRYRYPMLRPRHNFPEDPIPELAMKTGQAEKYAGKEKESLTWKRNIQEASEASRDAQHLYTADYVALNDEGKPVGSSSAAYAFVSSNGLPTWAFHGLNIMKDPSLLLHTASIYLWRADYLIARNEQVDIVGWYDGKGRWLEKVYTKFARLTPNATHLKPIAFNRYIRKADGKNPNYSLLPTSYSFGKFVRHVSSFENFSVGFGTPFLNLVGALDTVFHRNDESCFAHIRKIITEVSPERFYHANPDLVEALNIDGYDSHNLISVSRQFLSSGAALSHFHSSVEHSMAIARKKYA